MPTPRFVVHAPTKGVPFLGTVLTPSMTRTYAGWSSRGKVFGQPGTLGIPVADPAAIREDVNSLAAVGTFFSGCAPNVIFPALYHEADAPQDKEHFPGALQSDDQMPVPAGRPGNYVTMKPYLARHGGQRQVVQPQVVQRWAGLYGR
jgi:hypothetical protein